MDCFPWLSEEYASAEKQQAIVSFESKINRKILKLESQIDEASATLRIGEDEVKEEEAKLKAKSDVAPNQTGVGNTSEDERRTENGTFEERWCEVKALNWEFGKAKDHMSFAKREFTRLDLEVAELKRMQENFSANEVIEFRGKTEKR